MASIALVHDFLTGIGGDVRVLKAIHDMYPQAPIYCLTRDKKFTDSFFPEADIHPLFKTRHSKFLLPFFPSRIESLDLSSFDVVISTGSIFSKGLILKPRTFHINYCHSPTRQVWDLTHAYKRKLFQHFLRIWDRTASTRVDCFLANSENVRKRIKKYYGKDAEVIYPPVHIFPHTIHAEAKAPFYLIVSRLYKHKNIDIAINAFNKLELELYIIGDGPEFHRLRSLAGPTVHLMGSLPDDACSAYFDACNAFILPQEEDFGIAPVEAMLHGKPVLALRNGGALEYIEEGVNGLFFDDSHEAVLADGVRRMEKISFNSKVIRQCAQKFSTQKFQSSFSNIIDRISH